MMCLMIMEFIDWMMTESTAGKNDVTYDRLRTKTTATITI